MDVSELTKSEKPAFPKHYRLLSRQHNSPKVKNKNGSIKTCSSKLKKGIETNAKKTEKTNDEYAFHILYVGVAMSNR